MTSAESDVQPNNPERLKRLLAGFYLASQNEWVIFLFFLLLTLALRAFTFFQTNLGWDEGLYFAIARRILSGDILYVDVWDHKPPGIFFLFSATFNLLGKSIISIRLLACLSVALSCFLIHRLGKMLANNNATGLISAILYSFLTLNNEGLAANTEIFYNTFVLLAFYLLLRDNIEQHVVHPVCLFVIGLVIGLGIQIQYFVVFDFLAILLITSGLLYFHTREEGSSFFPQIFKALGILTAGTTLPFMIAGLYFIANGHFQDYIYANFTANSQYDFILGFSQEYFIQSVRQQVFSNALLWVSMILVPFYLFLFKVPSNPDKKVFAILLVWFSMALLSFLVTWRFYPHYFLHLLPPACLLSAYLISRIIYTNQQLDTRIRQLILSLILIVPLLQNFYPIVENSSALFFSRYIQKLEYWGNEPLEVADYLQEHISSNDYIFNVDYQPIIYFLVDAKIPTKYVFPLHLIDETHSKDAGVDAVKELASILSKSPLYIIKQYNQETHFYAVLDTYLQEEYQLEHSINNVQIYRLKDE